MYVPTQQIIVGPWRFFPEAMVAQNMHNGAWALFTRTQNGDWRLSCWHCPADWMLRELGEWFCKWIVGAESPRGRPT